MSDSRPKRDVLPEDTAPEGFDRATTPRGEAGAGATHRAAPGTEPYNTRTNPHTDERAPETAARTGGLITGMFFPVVILAVIALIVILYLVLA